MIGVAENLVLEGGILKESVDGVLEGGGFMGRGVVEGETAALVEFEGAYVLVLCLLLTAFAKLIVLKVRFSL